MPINDDIDPNAIPESERGERFFGRASSWDRRGNQTIRTISVPWDQRAETKLSILGYSTVGAGDSGEPIIQRYLPWQDFDDPSMIAVRIDEHPQGQRGAAYEDERPQMMSGTRFDWTNFAITFAQPRWHLGDRTYALNDDGLRVYFDLGEQPDFEQQRYCTKDVKRGIEYVSIKQGKGFIWGDGVPTKDSVVPFPVHVVSSFADIVITWMDVPEAAYPATAIADCEGKVNRTTMVLPDRPLPDTAAAESLLLVTTETRPVYFPDGSVGFDVLYYFKYRPQGFNNFLDPVRGVYRPIKRLNPDDTDEPYVFARADFDSLFRPEPGIITPAILVPVP